MRFAVASLVLLSLVASASAQTPKATDPTKDINNYLVDINSGAVSAMGLIDAKDMAVSTVETSQDLVLALNPLVSGSSGKKAFGLAITPARTTITPMSGYTYVTGGPLARLFGAATLSYAQNEADYATMKYRKQAASLNTLYYFSDDDDPIVLANRAFVSCANASADALVAKQKEINDERVAKRKEINDEPVASKIIDEVAQQRLEALTKGRQAELNKCIDPVLNKARWNAQRMTASIGYGRIKRDAGPGSSLSLGKSANVNLLFPMGPTGTRFGDKGSVQVSLRYARDAVDTTTLGTTPTFKNSNLAAVRLTYGDQEASALRVMAEASTAKNRQGDAFKEAFKYAVGVDKRVMEGLWFEFRLGRNRSVVDGKEQTTGMVSLNFQPTKSTYLKKS